MKYMCLIYTDPALTPPMGEKMNEAYFDLNRRLKAAGVMVTGDALQPATTATSVRSRGSACWVAAENRGGRRPGGATPGASAVSATG